MAREVRSFPGLDSCPDHLLTALEHEDVQAKIYTLVVRPVMITALASARDTIAEKVSGLREQMQQMQERIEESKPLTSPQCNAATGAGQEASKQTRDQCAATTQLEGVPSMCSPKTYKRKLRRRRCQSKFKYQRETLLQLRPIPAHEDIRKNAALSEPSALSVESIPLEQRLCNLEYIVTGTLLPGLACSQVDGQLPCPAGIPGETLASELEAAQKIQLAWRRHCARKRPSKMAEAAWSEAYTAMAESATTEAKAGEQTKSAWAMADDAKAKTAKPEAKDEVELKSPRVEVAAVGDYIVLQGLSDSELNGKHGTVLEHLRTGRLRVQLTRKASCRWIVAVKPTNVQVIESAVNIAEVRKLRDAGCSVTSLLAQGYSVTAIQLDDSTKKCNVCCRSRDICSCLYDLPGLLDRIPRSGIRSIQLPKRRLKFP